jgi:hypothetical protein
MFGDATRVGHKCKKARPTPMLREKSECRPALCEPSQPEVHQWKDIKDAKNCQQQVCEIRHQMPGGFELNSKG